ncbi:hypothetical protein C350_00872 [Cryptococcus neoformans MW-RSA36]|nr:hypothetical protein C350_00872 [Cryptococcus neoformans var. grubii MW-RSA36]
MSAHTIERVKCVMVHARDKREH